MAVVWALCLLRQRGGVVVVRGEDYAPGFSDDALQMMGRRTADERATFALGLLSEAGRVIHVGCGPGTITAGLARAAGPRTVLLGLDRAPSQMELAREAARAGGLTNTAFGVGSAYELPFPDRSVDVVFAHALFEHLAEPNRAVAEFRRILRGRGALALASSDWSGACINPRGVDVDQALRGHYVLRRCAGGDPRAGADLANWVRQAGYVDVHGNWVERSDMGYAELARYVGVRIEAALQQETHTPHERGELQGAAGAARRWASGTGTALQR